MAELTGETVDLAQENMERLKALFPDVFVEGKVDFAKLRQVLGEYVDESTENYSFTWNGKGEALKLAQMPTTGTLRPCKEESKNWDSTENIYIEGDNLEVLKLLQKSYFNKVKMIYIDPPYNTGKDFVYKDNFHDTIQNYKEITGQMDSAGNSVSTNSETSGRYHTDWLNMMYPRLRLARNLLIEDGVIFISIDDHEVANLKKICDEIFGEDNLVAFVPWQSRSSIQNDTDISNNHEFILIYAKTRKSCNRRLKETNQNEWRKKDGFVCKPLPLDKEKFSNPDNDPRGIWKDDPFDAPNIRPNLTYEIINPNTNEKFLPPKGRCWRTDEKQYLKLFNDKRIIFGKSGNSSPKLKVFYEEKKDFGSIENTWFSADRIGTTTQATKNLLLLFDNIITFDTPKPITLLLKLLYLANLDNDSIILDFFSGSATTAHAVMQLNAEDGGKRRYIMVQLPEQTSEKSEAYQAGYKNICEIGKERIRRAGEKIKAEKGMLAEDLDIGFKVFKLDSSNIIKWQPKEEKQSVEALKQQLMAMGQTIVTGRSELDVVYEIMLKQGYALTSSIEELIFAGKKVYSISAGLLFVCLAGGVTVEVADSIVSYIYIYI